MSNVVSMTQVHAGLALTSLLGFVVRGFWMMRGSPVLARRWVKVAPHIVDSVLLLSGITLVIQHQVYPNQQPWLAAKLVALVLYIVSGSIALKRGKTRAIQVSAFFAALAVFGYMLLAASTRSPLPF